MPVQVPSRVMPNFTSNSSTAVPWYSPGLGAISPQSHQLLETYSGIPPDQLESVILAIRDHAWAICNYPCIGNFQFLDLGISLQPLYPTIVKRLQAGETLLDLGCFFAQDVRKLVADGAPGENIWAADLHDEFIELGFDLFRDRGKLKAHFLTADVFDSESELTTLDGKIDIVQANMFFHLFSWDAQVAAVKRVVKLLRPKKGSLVLGLQAGNTDPGELVVEGTQSTFYFHDEESFRKLWKVVGEETGTDWVVNVMMTAPKGSKTWRDIPSRVGVPDTVPFTFEVHRVY